MPAYFNIGVLPTTSEDEQQGTGRIITFPNWLQHRVHSVYNHPDAEKAATRKIVSRDYILYATSNVDVLSL
jgi:hypothetical protein